MEDKFTRYSKLYILIFLLFLSIPVLIALLACVFYGFSTLVSSSLVDIIFQLLIICIPAALFASVDYIFFKRTKDHPAAFVRIFSKTLFAVSFILCLVLVTLDIISFFKDPAKDIISYHCFSILFLAGHVAGLFLIAIIQAFTSKKETDWMDRERLS